MNLFNQTKDKINISELEKLINFVLKKEDLNNIDLNVVFVDNQKIKEINKRYRNQNKATDVISFALEDHKFEIEPETRVLGDIYISIEQAKVQAKEYNHSLKREIFFLTIHGLYHLLGYDHQNKKEEKIMFQKQEEVLESYGIKRTDKKKGI